ncbi:MerR family transcriptional regulator [Roseovarius sp. S4756]|uniref:MerR family transcriptional regulator n=1 Tax=Roseovarius maritimus TaxID=3342637 RepID=UPI00372B7938
MSKSADAFRTISEVADWLGIPAHVLRFWESKFTQVKPVKRAGGRRYYRPADMQLLGGIRKLLHDDGMTIKGVQKVMRDQGVRHVASLSPPLDADLEGTVADMALDVPEAEEEQRGQVVNFERPAGSQPRVETSEGEDAAEEAGAGASAKDIAEAEAAPDTEAVEAEADTAEVDQTESAIDETTQNDSSTPQALPPDQTATRSPAPAKMTADEAADSGDPTPKEEAGQAAPAPAPERQSIAPVDTPDDPPDTMPAPASIVGKLANLKHVTAAEAADYADIANRLADLRQRMGDGRSPS